MVTVFRVRRFRVVIHSHDHRPPHVHVIGTEERAKFALRELGQDPVLMKNRGLLGKELDAVLAEITEKQGLLLQRWREIHGDD